MNSKVDETGNEMMQSSKSFSTTHSSKPMPKTKCTDDETSMNNDALIVDFPTRPRRRPTKKVQFADNAMLHQWIDPRRTPMETWHTKLDYKCFRRNLKRDVLIVRDQLMNGGRVSDDEESEERAFIRGMEHLICPITLQKIMDTREDHKNSVLDEEFRQNAYGVREANTMRAVSKEHSKWGKARAWAYAGGMPESRRGVVPPAA